MIDNLRIQRGQQSTQGLDPAKQKAMTGSLNGSQFRLRTEEDVDSKILAQRFRQSSGIDSPQGHKQLAERTLSLSQQNVAVDSESVSRFINSFRNNKKTSSLAQQYLQSFLNKTNRPSQEGNRSEMLSHVVALQKLVVALRGNEDNFIEQLTPLKSGSEKLSQLAGRLKEAGDDAKAIQDLLEDVDGMPQDQEQLASLMKTLRFQPDQLKKKLRDAQKLPELDQRTKAEVLEAVEDQLHELQRKHGSHLRAIDHALKNAGEHANAAIAESYSDLVHESQQKFVSTLELLLQKHSPDELSKQVIPLMKATLSHELGLADDQRSIDKVKLEFLLTELSHIHISNTLLEKLHSFVQSMQRMYGVAIA